MVDGRASERQGRAAVKRWWYVCRLPLAIVGIFGAAFIAGHCEVKAKFAAREAFAAGVKACETVALHPNGEAFCYRCPGQPMVCWTADW